MRPRPIVEARVRAAVFAVLGRFGHRAKLVTFDGLPDRDEHLAFTFEQRAAADDAPLVRIHSECLTGDVFGSTRCDCGLQLEESITRLASSGGILLYLRQEGRGIGLYSKLDAYVLQDQGFDTFEANRMLGKPADARDYGVAASMLKALGAARIRLLTNNPDKVRQLRLFGIEVAEMVATGVYITSDNIAYLRAKAELADHNLNLERS